MTRILLIEDDAETAEVIVAELADRGFDVQWAPDGVDGLDRARAACPDAMIVDRMLPGMDGLTVIEALRKDRVGTPVLVLSALGAVDDRVRGLRAGGVPTSLGPCWLQTPPLRTKTHAAPAFAASLIPPMMAVLPSPESATE